MTLIIVLGLVIMMYINSAENVIRTCLDEKQGVVEECNKIKFY